MNKRVAYALALAALSAGCANNPEVPVTDRSSVSKPDTPNTSYGSGTKSTGDFHVVQSGDTLFSIAWGAGVDFQALARWNGIDSPYIIRPGERLTLVPSREYLSKNTAVSQPKPANKTKKTAGSAGKKNLKIPSKTEEKAFKGGANGWIWPVKGPILKGFSASGSNKGIDIGGSRGHGVRAAAGGKVVYAGSGLRGYGQLIIVKHDEVYLSAYAHNSKLLVEDGQKVSSGQQIALMGDTGTDRVKLHFEIRRRGKPVDPLKFLPARP